MVDYEKKLCEAKLHLEMAISRNPVPTVKEVAYAGIDFIKKFMTFLDFNRRDPYDYVPGVHDLEKAIEDISHLLEKEGRDS